MRRRFARSFISGLFVAGLLAAPLAGCSTANFGNAFGPSQPVATADLPEVGDYTVADVALADARSHFRNNDFGYSAALYQKVVNLSPHDPDGYVGLAASYDRLGRFDLSDRVYASLYVLTGGTAQYYNNLAYSNMLRGNLTAALTDFRKAKAVDPGNVIVANNIRMLESGTAGA